MSSNWTVVVFTQMVTGRSLSLSLLLLLLSSAIYIYHKATDDMCAVCVSRPSSLFVVLDVVVVARFGGAVLLLCLLRRPKIGLEKLSDERVLTIAP